MCSDCVDRGDRGARGLVFVGPEVSVGVEGGFRRGVPQPRLHDLHVEAGGDQQRRRVVPKVVEPELGRQTLDLGSCVAYGSLDGPGLGDGSFVLGSDNGQPSPWRDSDGELLGDFVRIEMGVLLVSDSVARLATGSPGDDSADEVDILGASRCRLGRPQPGVSAEQDSGSDDQQLRRSAEPDLFHGFDVRHCFLCPATFCGSRDAGNHAVMHGVAEELREASMEGIYVRVGPPLGLGSRSSHGRTTADRSHRRAQKCSLISFRCASACRTVDFGGAVAVKPLSLHSPTVSLATFGATWSPRTMEAIASLSHFWASTFRSSGACAPFRHSRRTEPAIG